MGRLNQLLAVEKSVRATTQRAVTDAYHSLQKTALFAGLSRTYEPLAEDGIKLPDEYTKPQLDAHSLLEDALSEPVKQWDLEATKDETNKSTAARADVKLPNGTVLLANVTGTTLLYLEKQLEDVKTVANALPTLDPAVDWDVDTNTGNWKSKPVQTIRSQKVPRNHELAPATDRHAAQIHLWHEDVPVGTWTMVKQSTAVSEAEKYALLDRINTVQQAVKKAREEANVAPVVDRKIGDKITAFILGHH